MNEEKMESRIERGWDRRRFDREGHERWRRHGSRWVGLFFLVVGGLLLARASGVYFPGWFFTWPMFLIGFGIFSGARHGFRNIGWLIPVVIGGLFLADQLSPDLRLKPYIWPLALIV